MVIPNTNSVLTLLRVADGRFQQGGNNQRVQRLEEAAMMFQTTARLCDRRVLIVDEIATYRDPLKRHLDRAGYQVETTDNGYSALAKVESAPPDLLLLAARLPDLDGYEVAHWVSQNQPSVMILLIADCCDISKLEGSIASVVDCVCHPLPLEEIVDKVQALIPVLSLPQLRKK